MTKTALLIRAFTAATAAMLLSAPMAYAGPDDQNDTEQSEEEQDQNGAPNMPDLNQGQQQQSSSIEEYIEQQRAQGKNGVIYIVNGAPVCVLYGEVTSFGAAAVTVSSPVQYC